ncbi:MAG: hypothetical protein HOP19_08520 [Acidobacteria bacterium]|nr:hypothetical protein [Acidobacteriota bacterium]
MTNSPPHLVVLLPRGETIRNFIYSGALEAVQKQLPVTLISVLPDATINQQLTNRFASVHELTTDPDPWLVRWLRLQLDVVHGRHLWSEAAKERWRRRDAEAVTPSKKAKRLISKALTLFFANEAGLNALNALERQTSRTLSTSNHYTELMRQLRPSLVFNASHIHSPNATQAVQAAQWLGIPTATFLFSWDNLTSQGRIMLPYDHYFAWNQTIAEQLLEIYPRVRREQVIVTGTPQFDFHFRSEFHESRETFCARVGLDPARPFVLYSTGMDNHMPGEPRIIEGIALILRSLDEFQRPQLLVRLYPKDRHPERFDEMRRANPDILFPEIPWNKNHQTPQFEDCAFLTNTLRHCALGINIASTISLELAMLDKPVINVGYNPPELDISPIDYRVYYGFDHYRPVVESGAVRLANSETEMRDLIVAALRNPAQDAALRARFTRQMFGDTLNGRVAEGLAQHLIRLAHARNG